MEDQVRFRDFDHKIGQDFDRKSSHDFDRRICLNSLTELKKCSASTLPGAASPGVDSLGGHCERLAGGHRVGRFHILTNFIYTYNFHLCSTSVFGFSSVVRKLKKKNSREICSLCSWFPVKVATKQAPCPTSRQFASSTPSSLQMCLVTGP